MLQPPLHAPKLPALFQRVARYPSLSAFALQHGCTEERLEKMFIAQGIYENKEQIPPNALKKIRASLFSPRIRKTNAEVLAHLINVQKPITYLHRSSVPVHMLWGVQDRMYELSKEMEQQHL